MKAFGAQPSRVLRTMLGEVTILIGIGLAIGLAATAGATRFIASLLYGVRPNDPSTLSVTAATLAFVAVIAGFLPARRASRLDPMDALREE
jgi:ABC-type antimicrobial peptide transport system permease subunit